jgi:hypothetical protein
MSQLIGDASGYVEIEFDTRIPELSQTADIVEAFKLYHFGIDSYNGSEEPSSNSLHSHLKVLKDSLSENSSNYITNLSASVSSVENIDLETSKNHYYYDNLTANFEINLRWNQETSLNSKLNSGDSLKVKIIINNGATPYSVTSVSLGSSTVSLKWLNGSLPSGLANSSGEYDFFIIKDGEDQFKILGSLKNYS